MDIMTDRLHYLKYAITALGIRSVYCELIGIDYNTYNGTQGLNTLQQDIINQAIPHLNSVIVNINEDTCMVTPWIQKTIHVPKGNGKRKPRYNRLRDGLHPLPLTAGFWSFYIVEAIIKNVSALEAAGAFI